MVFQSPPPQINALQSAAGLALPRRRVRQSVVTIQSACDSRARTEGCSCFLYMSMCVTGRVRVRVRVTVRVR